LSTTNGRVRVKGDLPSCDVTATNGSIDVHGGTQRLSITKTNGRIEAKTYAQELHLETNNARIEAEIFRKTGLSGNIKSHNGSIRLRLAEDANAQLVCTTHNGHVDYDDLDNNASLTIIKGGRHRQEEKVTVTLGQGGTPLMVGSHNGSIRLRQGLDEWELTPPTADEEKKDEEEEISQNPTAAPRWVVVDGKRIEIDAKGVVLEGGATVKLGENGEVIISRPPVVAEAAANEAPARAPTPAVKKRPSVDPRPAAEPAELNKAAEPSRPSDPGEPAEPKDAADSPESAQPSEASEPQQAQPSDDTETPDNTQTSEDADSDDHVAAESDDDAVSTSDDEQAESDEEEEAKSKEPASSSDE